MKNFIKNIFLITIITLQTQNSFCMLGQTRRFLADLLPLLNQTSSNPRMFSPLCQNSFCSKKLYQDSEKTLQAIKERIGKQKKFTLCIDNHKSAETNNIDHLLDVIKIHIIEKQLKNFNLKKEKIFFIQDLTAEESVNLLAHSMLSNILVPAAIYYSITESCFINKEIKDNFETTIESYQKFLRDNGLDYKNLTFSCCDSNNGKGLILNISTDETGAQEVKIDPI